jgi:hypothetical protein
MSEQLLLINPRGKRRKKRKSHRRMPAALRRYWAKHRKHRRRTRNPKRASARRRPAMGYVVGTGRIRRRKLNPHRRRHYARYHYRRRRMRNPRLPFGLGGIVKQTVMPAAIGATGAIALDVAYGYVAPHLPPMLQSGFLPLLVKIAGALGIGYAASKILGRERAKAVTLGAVTVVAYGGLKPLIAGMFPTIKGLAGYADFVDYSVGRVPSGVGAYMAPGSSAVPQHLRGLGFYSPASVMAGTDSGYDSSGVGAYLPRGGMHGFGDPSAYDWRNDGM